MTNEKRLIDANEQKALFDERYDSAFVQMHTRDNKEYWNGFCAGVNWGRNTIADAPTVDAVEVVHGRWIETLVPDGYVQKASRMRKQCSVCGWTNACRYHYCPNCGAKMDGDRNG